MKEIIVTGKSIKHMMQNKKVMKSQVKTSALGFNRENHGTNNNYVLSIIKTNKMFPIVATDPNNLENPQKHSESFLLRSAQCLWCVINTSEVMLLGKEVAPEL